jgi:hypothetical protein
MTNGQTGASFCYIDSPHTEIMPPPRLTAAYRISPTAA